MDTAIIMHANTLTKNDGLYIATITALNVPVTLQVTQSLTKRKTSHA